MRKTEIILGIIIITAVIMNLSMIPFSGPLHVVSIGTLAMFYLFLSYFIFNNIKLSDLSDPNTFKGIPAIKTIGTIGLGKSLAITLMGILFKLMSWPGATPMIVPVLVLLSIILIIAYQRYYKTRSYIYVIIIKRIAIIGGAGLILFLLPKYAIIEFKYRNYPSYVEAVKLRDADPRNKKLNERVNFERDEINKSIKQSN